ncbi:MAG: Rieske 2Fe-2S domain-containing protein [Cyclobacteriaceae bacterium]
MSREWHKLFENWEAAVQAIPDSGIRRATVNGVRMSLIRYREKLWAVNDQCPHMKASLGDGRLNGFGEIICPLHHYRFKLSNGQESENRCDDLEVHTIEQREDGIYIGIYKK